MAAVNRWLITLVWLLSLALPLQGLAASTRLMCHAVPAAGMTADAPKCHEEAGDAGDATPTHTGCIACAACHGAAALPASVPVLGQPAPTMAPEALTTRAVPNFVTDGPDRPPRAHLV